MNEKKPNNPAKTYAWIFESSGGAESLKNEKNENSIDKKKQNNNNRPRNYQKIRAKMSSLI